MNESLSPPIAAALTVIAAQWRSTFPNTAHRGDFLKELGRCAPFGICKPNTHPMAPDKPRPDEVTDHARDPVALEPVEDPHVPPVATG